MLCYVQKTASNVIYCIEGTAGNITLPCVGESPLNKKMHYVQEIIGNTMRPIFQKL
jgi:hypothetical protein